MVVPCETPGFRPASGSSAAQRPRSRWLAHEAPRQVIAAVVPMVPFTIVLRTGDVTGVDYLAQRVVSAFGGYMLALALLYAGLTWLAFRGAAGEQLRRLAVASAPKSRREVRWMRWFGIDEVSLAFSAALVTVLSTITLLALPDQLRVSGPATAGALAAAASAWVLIVIGYATRYLRLWALRGGLRFAADDEPPEFSDFVHLSVHQSTGYGAPTARLRAVEARRIATVQSALAWVFNTVIVALLVTVALPAVV